ncbi:MAG: glycosyltransferase [Bryobacteraceae bacterium]|nr:glycosyltransferase [Bryobacteraceae bacterium]MDW8377193.1 glycosyltransferase [Bryobacterales bacterium]
MKSLHLTNAWHPKSGGVRTFYLALMEAANQHGHRMRLVVPSDATRVENVGAHGKIYHVQAPRAPFSPSYRVLYPHRYLFPGSMVHRILKEEEPDLIEICDKFTLPYLGGLLRVGLLAGVRFRPTVVNLSCERVDDALAAYAMPERLARAFSRLFLRWLYFPLADHHIAVSDYVATELKAVSNGHKVDRGVWLGPMGVDYELFSSAGGTNACQEWYRWELEERVQGRRSSRLLVYAGRLAPEKNLSLLVRLMGVLANKGEQDYRLVVAGDGPLRGELEADCECVAPGRVHFLGHIASRSELARLFAHCDLFIHPNPREPFGIGPLEAMAAALPVVLPNTGGVTMYANQQNSYCADPTPEAFAEAVEQVFKDRARRDQVVQAALATASENSWAHAARHFLETYRVIHAQVQGRQCSGPQPLFISTREYF